MLINVSAPPPRWAVVCTAITVPDMAANELVHKTDRNEMSSAVFKSAFMVSAAATGECLLRIITVSTDALLKKYSG